MAWCRGAIAHQRGEYGLQCGQTRDIQVLPEAGRLNPGSLFGYSLPNLFFHLSTAYDILRNKGLKIGKRDFIGPFITGYATLPQQ